MVLADRLRNRIYVYGKVKYINELDEVDYKFDRIKSVWAEILPTGGSLANGQGNAVYAQVTHKITIRNKSIPNLANDMYFMYQGQRFDINFFQPHYKYKDCIEIMCNLIVENPSDVGVSDNE